MYHQASFLCLTVIKHYKLSIYQLFLQYLKIFKIEVFMHYIPDDMKFSHIIPNIHRFPNMGIFFITQCPTVNQCALYTVQYTVRIQ